MLLYDNKGRTRLILQVYGSIYRRVWFTALVVAVYSCTLHVAFWYFLPHWRPNLDSPYTAQSLSVLISFSVCFRTNIAWNRYWEACQEITFMYSKWCDAYSQLQGFITSKIKSPTTGGNEAMKLEHLRFEITHYFSMLSAMAVERLLRGDIRRMQLRRSQGAAWSEQVVFREHLRYHDIVGSKRLCRTKPIDFQELQRMSKRSPSGDEELGEGMPLPQPARTTRCFRRRTAAHARPSSKLKKLGKDHIRNASVYTSHAEDEDTWQGPLPIIGSISNEEKTRLQVSEDRPNLVISWVYQSVTELAPMLSVPAPILSRVYQEISNGALGYSQAEKLADIPFPFIFAQLLALMVLVFALVSPITFEIISGKTPITPFISTAVVLSFWSLNEMAKELENPLGIEANNVPVVDYHERYLAFLGEIHACELPEDRGYRDESEYEGVRSSMASSLVPAQHSSPAPPAPFTAICPDPPCPEEDPARGRRAEAGRSGHAS